MFSTTLICSIFLVNIILLLVITEAKENNVNVVCAKMSERI
jgi:hypothetical protein